MPSKTVDMVASMTMNLTTIMIMAAVTTVNSVINNVAAAASFFIALHSFRYLG
jgi:hypothetical protein